MQELTWWRRRRPDALSRGELDRLHARLIEVTPTDYDRALPALVAKATDSGMAAFRVALLLQRENPTTQLAGDLVASWLLLCAQGPGRLGQRRSDAARMLLELHASAALVLRQDRPRPGARFAAGRRLVIARCYADRGGSWLTLFKDDLHEAIEAGEHADATAEPARESGAPIADAPTKQVIQADALPGPHRHDDRKLIETYKPLLDPLPLAGDPAVLPRLADDWERVFPWLTPFSDFLRDELGLQCYAGRPFLYLRPVLLVGPPGCGKTLAARRLADLAGVGADLLSLGGSSDARHLLGTARGWASAQPCGPIVAVQRHGCANPVLVLDELEKAGGSAQNGRVQSALLAMLEPVSAQRFYDEALNVQTDLSAINWIATANDAGPIDAALRSRLTIVQVPAPGAPHLDAILAQLAGDTAAELGIRRAALPDLDHETRSALHADLEAYGDVRRIARGYRRAVAAAVRNCKPLTDA